MAPAIAQKHRVLIATALLLLIAIASLASTTPIIQLEPFDLEDVALEGESLHKAHASLNEECVRLGFFGSLLRL
jgi:hypothetical protein